MAYSFSAPVNFESAWVMSSRIRPTSSPSRALSLRLWAPGCSGPARAPLALPNARRASVVGILHSMSRVRVFIACSLDGFIAGPNDDLSWLPQPPEGSDDDYGWGDFIGSIGCLLMGRATYDVVAAMDVA